MKNNTNHNNYYYHYYYQHYYYHYHCNTANRISISLPTHIPTPISKPKMRLSVILSLATTGMATAFHLPEGAVDGVYTLKEGAAELELLMEHNSTSAEAAVTKRGAVPVSDTGCTSIILDSVNYQQALADLTTTCGQQEVPAKSGLLAVVGSAQVFACSWAGHTSCKDWELNEVMGDLDAKCGNLRQGGVLIQDWGKAIGRGVIGTKSCW